MTISIIIPAHNASRTIVKTIKSILAQSKLPEEIIVVDDGSADNLQSYLSLIRANVRLERIAHAGAAAARNAGARQAKGDALFFCDADIELFPTALQKLEKALADNPNAVFAYSAFEWGGRIFGNRDFDPEEVRRNNYISTMSLISRSAFPGFDETLPRFQDWDLWLTIIERGGNGARVPEVLFRVLEEGKMSRRGGLSRLRATAAVRKKHRLSWRISDFWLAFKESLRAGRL
ncbi:glycosyltransferase family 2 protein [Patescibacteria group bacterium]|nr:MAG: glycosyltransferase family 2 protein [Patescibacteria group bacterium]